MQEIVCVSLPVDTLLMLEAIGPKEWWWVDGDNAVSWSA